MSAYFLTPQALTDLFDIWQYVADNSGSERADRLHRAFVAAFARLAEMPGLGHVHSRLADENLRVWAVNSYLILYRPHTSPLQIMRILHGARDIGALSDDLN